MNNLDNYIPKWIECAKKNSGNYASDYPMPTEIIEKLFYNHDNITGIRALSEIPIHPKELTSQLNQLGGLRLLSYLQKLNIPGHLAVYRAIRFPTEQRTREVLLYNGISTINYEHERLLSLYNDKDYISKREQIKCDKRFDLQLQERIVKGLPIFFMVNDSIQIHRAFRCHSKDKIIIIVAFIPLHLLKNGNIRIISNVPLAESYDNDSNDYDITEFTIINNNMVEMDWNRLRRQGINLYEAYLTGVPYSISDCESLDIKQKYYMVDIYRPHINCKIKSINDVIISDQILDANHSFMFGFFGDYHIFGRRCSEYLPLKCHEIFVGK